MNRIVLAIVLLVICVTVILVFTVPAMMIQPGKVIIAHQQFNNDCRICHTFFNSSKHLKCIGCHNLDSIGMTSRSAGITTGKRLVSNGFHRQLKNTECHNCHTEHVGYRMKNPKALFRHDLISVSVINQCGNCHQKPTDDYHRSLVWNCKDCHDLSSWKNVSMDHSKYFLFDANHPSGCKTCHNQGTLKTYTCYGCHEHSSSEILSKHQEAGITDIENCVKCHRSSAEKEHGEERLHDDEKGEEDDD